METLETNGLYSPFVPLCHYGMLFNYASGPIGPYSWLLIHTHVAQLTHSFDIFTFVKCYPITGLGRPLGYQEVWGSQISRQTAHEGGKVVSPTYRPPLHPMKYFRYSFMLEAGSTPGHSAAGRIMSMKISSDTIGSRTRHLPACSSLPEPTTALRAPYILHTCTSLSVVECVSNDCVS
jgi:hypothetical protein